MSVLAGGGPTGGDALRLTGGSNYTWDGAYHINAMSRQTVSIDLTNYAQISFYARLISGQAFAVVTIDGTRQWGQGNYSGSGLTTTWTKYTVDVSGFTGTKTLFFAGGGLTIEYGGTIEFSDIVFQLARAVTFGGVPATSFTVDSDTQITAVVPASALPGNDTTPSASPFKEGKVDVVLTNSTGEVATLPQSYTYRAPMSISSISPAVGSIGGNTNVTITGHNFIPLGGNSTTATASTTVKFGGVNATNVTVVDNNTITATTPAAASAGTVAVEVDNGSDGPATWTVVQGGFEYTMAISTNLDYEAEAVSYLDTAHNPGAVKWFWSTTNTAGSWTSFTPNGSGAYPLASMNSAPANSGGGDKTLYIAYANSAGATDPVSSVSTITIKPRPAAPASLGLTGGTNQISGVVVSTVTDGQEFRTDVTGSSYNNVTANPQSTSGIGNGYGDYLVRVKASNTNANFSSPDTSVKVYRPGSIVINSNADKTFTYPKTFASDVTLNTITVTNNTATPTWYYMDAVANPTKPAAGAGSWTTGTPAACGEYWVYASVAADSGATDFYAAVTSAVIKVTWNKKVLAVGGLSFSKVYDGSTTATATGSPTLTTNSGAGVDAPGEVMNGDSVTIANGNGSNGATAPTYTYSTRNANVTNTTVSLSGGGFVLGGGQAGFYTLPASYSAYWTGTITTRPIAVSFAGLVFQKTYDGNATATHTSSSTPVLVAVSGNSDSGEISGDSLTLLRAGVTYFYGTSSSTSTSSASASANQSVYITSGTQGNFVLDSTNANASNYQLATPLQTTAVSTTGQIMRKQVTSLNWTLDGASPMEVNYDGNNHTISAAVPSSQLIGSDVVTVPLTGNVTESAVSATYSATAASGALTGAAGANYTLASSISQSWKITATAPGAPGTPTASGSPASVQLSWTAPGSNGGVTLTTYEVQYVDVGPRPQSVPSDSSLTNWSSATSATVSGATLSYTVPTTLDTNRTYAARVRASNDGGSTWGAWSDAGQVNPNRYTPVLTVPTITLDYGDTLSAVSLGGSGFSAQVPNPAPSGYTAGQAINGTWSWDYTAESTSGTYVPTVAITQLTVRFTPVNEAVPVPTTVEEDFNSNTYLATISVAPKALTIDFSGLAFSRVYDGTTQANTGTPGKTGSPSIQNASTAVISGDSVSVTDSGVNYIYEQSNVGTGLNVYVANDGSVSNLTLQGGAAGNYSIANMPVTTGTRTVIKNTGEIKVYPLSFTWSLDGTINAAPFTTTFDNTLHNMVASATGVAGETIAVATYDTTSGRTASETNANASATANYTAGVGSITVNGGSAGASNYSLSTNVTQVWHINKATVAVLWSAATFAYNGAVQAPSATYAPVVGDTNPAVFTSTIASGPSSSGAAINAGAYTITAAANSNYQPQAATQTGSFSITPKSIVLDFASIDQSHFIYNGTDIHAVSPTIMPAISAGQTYARDNVFVDAGSAKWQLAGTTVNAGAAYTVQVQGEFGLSGLGASNYEVSQAAGSYAGITGVSAYIDPRVAQFRWTVDGVAVTSSTSPFNLGELITALFAPTPAYAAGEAAASPAGDLGDPLIAAFSAANPFVITYDGNPHTVGAIVTNAVTGEPITVANYSLPSIITEAAAGSYVATITALGDASATGLEANYTLIGSPDLEFYWTIIDDPASPGASPGGILPQTGAFLHNNSLAVLLLSAGMLVGLWFYMVPLRRRRHTTS